MIRLKTKQSDSLITLVKDKLLIELYEKDDIIDVAYERLDEVIYKNTKKVNYVYKAWRLYGEGSSS